MFYLEYLDKKDVIALTIIIVFLIMLLIQPNTYSIDSYQFLSNTKERGIDPNFLSSILPFIPVLFGVIIVKGLYLILRIKGGFDILPVSLAVLIIILSTTFINNFSAFSTQNWVNVIFLGENLGLNIFDISGDISKIIADNIADNIFVLLLGTVGISKFVIDKKEKGIITILIGLIGIVLSFITPLLGILLLAYFCCYGIKLLDSDKRKENMVFGAILSLAIIISLVGLTEGRIAGFSIFSAIIVGIGLYFSEKRKMINLLLFISFIFVSMITATNIVFAKRGFDSETEAVFGYLKTIDETEKIAFISIYSERMIPAVNYLSNKNLSNSSFNKGLNFIFSKKSENTTHDFDYLVLDLLALDEPNYFANLANKTARFETFAFVSQQKNKETGQNYAIFSSNKNYITMFVDENGILISDKIYIGNEESSIYRLLKLEGEGYFRYIHPKGETNLNIFGILFPEETGDIGNLSINEVWSSNSSRIRVYEMS